MEESESITEKEEIKFLEESNKIESEYSEEALQDAIQAWTCGKIALFISKEELSIDLICAIHRRLMKRLNPRIAGKIRKCDVWVGRRKGLKPSLIKKELKEWCETWNSYFGLEDTLEETGYKKEEVVKDFHINFEKIHPFEDGNGRTGRILMNLQRLAIGLPILVIHEGKEQYEYYKWFRERN